MASNDYGVLFPTSVVGSVPRPDFVRDLISDEKISPAEYDQRMEAAVRYVVAMQENAGLDILTDGEWWRKSYIGVIAELAHGFEVGTNPADGRPWTIVVDKLSPKKPGTIAREVSVLKKITKSKVKATLPAPALLGERMWDPQKSSKAYPNRDDFVRDCAIVLHCPAPEAARAMARDLIAALAPKLTGAELDGPHTYSLLHTLSVAG